MSELAVKKILNVKSPTIVDSYYEDEDFEPEEQEYKKTLDNTGVSEREYNISISIEKEIWFFKW